MINRLILIIASIFLTGCANQTMMRAHKSYEETVPRLKNVILLPPSVEVRARDTGGGAGKRQYNYEQQLEGTITETLVAYLRTKNYKPKLVTRREIHNQNISKSYAIFKDEFVDKMKSVYPTLLMDKQKAMDMNVVLKRSFDEVVDDKNKDFFLMIDYYSQTNSTASCLLKGLAGSGDPFDDAPESVSIRATIIDAKNYRILWSNVTRDAYSLFGTAFSNLSSTDKVDRKRLPKFYKDLFKALPDKIGRD